MPGLVVEMTAEEADLFSKMTALVSKTNESERAFGRASQESQEAAKAAREAAREQEKSANAGKRLAQQLQKANESLEQSYNRQVKTLEAGFESGKISSEQLREAVGQLDQKFDDLRKAEEQAAREGTDAFKMQQREIEAGISAVKRMERETEGLEDEHKRLKREIRSAYDAGKISASAYEGAMRRVEAKVGDVNLKNKAAELSGKKTFGAPAVDKVATYAASILTIGTAWQAAMKVVEQYNKEKDKAVESVDQTADTRRAFSQIAEDSNDYQGLVDSSNRVAAYTGDLAEAQKFVFSGRSEGFDAEALAKFIPVVSSDALAGVAGQVNTLYGGDINAQQTINAVLAGAKSSRLDFENLSGGLASVAEGGRMQKSSAEEQIGSLSVLASFFKSGDTAGDRLKAFQTRLALGGQEFGVSGQGIVAATEQIQAMSPEDRKKLLGDSQEVNAAFSALSENLPTIKERITTINEAIGLTGTKDSPLEKALASQFDTSTEQGRINLAELEARKAEIGYTVTNQSNNAIAGLETKTGAAASQQALQNNGTGVIGRTIASSYYNAMTMMGADPETASVAAYSAGSNPMRFALRAGILNPAGSFNPQEQAANTANVAAEMAAALKRQTETMEKIEANTRKPMTTKPGDDS